MSKPDHLLKSGFFFLGVFGVLFLDADPTRAQTFTATPTPTYSITKTYTPTPTISITPTWMVTPPSFTSTPTLTATGTPTATPTVTHPVSGCLTIGNHDPSPVITITLEPNAYLTNAFPATCGAPFNELQVYAGNFSGAPATLELAVYDGGFEIVQGYLKVPASSEGWYSMPIPPVNLNCGDPIDLVAHSMGTTLFLGAASDAMTCNSDGGVYPGPMPADYSQAAPTSVVSGWCYEMSLDSCGNPQTVTSTPSPAMTGTFTPTFTPTYTITATPTDSATVTPTSSPALTASATASSTPTAFFTPSWTPSASPTVTSSPSGPVTYVYINPAGACASAFGCSIQVVNACRQLNLDSATSYMIMRICALAGCQPADVMNLRLTMGWDEICAHYGIDWSTFTTDVQTRTNTLTPEIITPNQIIRAAANDPTQFPVSNPPGSMPDTLILNAPITEVCPLCQ